MIKVPGRQSKSKQYVIGGIVAAIILFMWISIPLMSNSSLDSSVSGSPFKSRPADLGALNDGYSSDLPGQVLDGTMTDNPATSGEMIASSLFQLGPSDTETPGLEDSVSASGVSGGVGGGASAGGGGAFGAGGGPARFAPKGKVGGLGNIGGASGGGSQTSGGKHEKFFGGGGNAKADMSPILPPSDGKGPGGEKKNAYLTALQNMDTKSSKAAQARTIVGARGGATSAFVGGKAKPDSLVKATEMLAGAGAAGLSGGGASAIEELKGSDPKSKKPNFTPPKPEAKEAKDDENEKFKQMLIQMLIQSLLGPIFSNMASSLFSTGGTTTPTK